MDNLLKLKKWLEKLNKRMITESKQNFIFLKQTYFPSITLYDWGELSETTWRSRW